MLEGITAAAVTAALDRAGLTKEEAETLIGRVATMMDRVDELWADLKQRQKANAARPPLPPSPSPTAPVGANGIHE